MIVAGSLFLFMGTQNYLYLPANLLHITSLALRASFFQIFMAIFVPLCIQVVWLLVCGCVIYYCYNNTTAVPATTWVPLLISGLWGSHVIQGCTQATLAGTVASWWFQPNRINPVGASALRVCTISFGSVCLQGLYSFSRYLEFVGFLYMVVYTTSVQICTGRIVPFDLSSLGIQCIDIYFSAYTLPYIAGHGESYLNSCRKAHELINRYLYFIELELSSSLPLLSS